MAVGQMRMGVRQTMVRFGFWVWVFWATPMVNRFKWMMNMAVGQTVVVRCVVLGRCPRLC